MQKIRASIIKEFLQLINDRTGLALMFVMPVLLVFTITIIQDSVYRVVNENKIPIMVVNHDRGQQGVLLVQKLRESGVFEIELQNHLTYTGIGAELASKGKLMALYIPADLTSGITETAGEVSQLMLKDMGLDADSLVRKPGKMPSLEFFHDPVLQENYTVSLVNIVRSYMSSLEIGLVIEKLYADSEIDGSAGKLKEKMLQNNVQVISRIARTENSSPNPNSTQHNVPAWTIFAMFFMVVSLGGNIVKERLSGAFLRLKTMPTNFGVVMICKMIVYVIVAVIQVALVFSIGLAILPSLGLPQLNLPAHFPAFAVVVFLISLCAVSYALLVGTYARTTEQANGFGAISVVFFAAIGGIWVPSFMMPNYMKIAGYFSPLHWCLEAFYILFLKGGNWFDLRWVLMFLVVFIVFCQLFTYFKLKSDKIV